MTGLIRHPPEFKEIAGQARNDGGSGATFFREVAINFSIKTVGVFDVVLPVLEDDEMFNSGLLKEHVGQMISSGRRHVAIDISPLDYIYSDGINALVTLNKRAQEAGGALALLSPQAKVVGILQTAGVQSAMSVLSGEAELAGLSNEIAAAAGSAAQSEFESLRSEIGSVFGDDAPQSGHAPPPPPPPAYAPPPPVYTPPPVYAPPPAMEPVYAPPPAMEPVYAPPPAVEPVYAPPPAAPDAMELQPMAPPPPTAPAFPPPDAFPSETMAFGELGGGAFGSLDAPPKAPSFDDFDDDFGGKKKKKAKDPFDDDDFGVKKKAKDPFDDDDFGVKKKKFPKEPLDDFGGDDDGVFKAERKRGAPVGAIAALIALLALAGGGYVFFVQMGGRIGGDAAPTSAAVPPADKPSGPTGGPDMSASDIPVTTIEVEAPKPMTYTPGAKSKPDNKNDKPDTKQKSAPPSTPYPAPSYSTPTPSYSTPTPSYSTPTPSYSTPTPSYSTPTPSYSTPTPSYSTPTPSYSTPEPPPPPPPPKVEQVTVTSNPSGATVEVDGRRAGVTPYTFKPASWGDITIAVSMSGYEKATKTVEFEGGTLNVPFSLSRAAAAPPPSAPPPSRPSAPAGATIFIATLPPKAEVYIGGRLLGTSNEGELQVPTGTHQVRFVKDGVEKTETITFNPGKNPTRFVNLKQ